MNFFKCIIYLFLVIYSFPVIGQIQFEGMKLDFAYSEYAPDTSLSHLKDRYGRTVLEIIEENGFTNTRETYFGVSSMFTVTSFVGFEVGLGYSKTVYDVKLPLVLRYFENNNKILLLNDIYKDHRLQLNVFPKLRYPIGRFTPFIGLNFLSTVSFHKSVQPLGREAKLSKSKFNLSGYEIFQEVGLKFSPFTIKLGHRIFNRAYNDPGIVDSDIAIRSANPAKFRMTFSVLL